VCPTTLGAVMSRDLRAPLSADLRRAARPGTPRRVRGRSRWRALLAAVVAVLAVATAGCTDGGPVAEVDDRTGAVEEVRVPPQFPPTGPVPDDLVVEGLEFDLTDAPSDLSLWVASPDEARCAADRIVAAIGSTRLVALGYEPATPGFGLTDLALTDAERTTVVTLFSDCVDLTLAVGSLLAGDNQLPPAAAKCLAEGLDERNQLDAFARSWGFSRPIDPFADEGALSVALSDLSKVCLVADAFTWYDTELPGDPPADERRPAAPTTTPSARRPVVPGDAQGPQS
jgi:hypothetical protein